MQDKVSNVGENKNKKILKELALFKTEDEMNRFFDDERFRKFHYLTYAEYVEIFSNTVDPNFLPKINKKIIYGHFDYFNYCYDSSWKYKWYPIMTVFAINLSKYSKELIFPLNHILVHI